MGSIEKSVAQYRDNASNKCEKSLGRIAFKGKYYKLVRFLLLVDIDINAIKIASELISREIVCKQQATAD